MHNRAGSRNVHAFFIPRNRPHVKGAGARLQDANDAAWQNVLTQKQRQHVKGAGARLHDAKEAARPHVRHSTTQTAQTVKRAGARLQDAKQRAETVKRAGARLHDTNEATRPHKLFVRGTLDARHFFRAFLWHFQALVQLTACRAVIVRESLGYWGEETGY